MVNTKLLKERRKALDLSQEEVAEKVGVPLSQYQKFEKGEEEPSPSTVLVLAFLLGVEAEELMGKVEVEDEPSRNVTFDGRKLWDARLEKGISRAELGEIIGVNKKTIDNWEHGLMCPVAENRRLLEAYFGVKKGHFDLS